MFLNASLIMHLFYKKCKIPIIKINGQIMAEVDVRIVNDNKADMSEKCIEEFLNYSGEYAQMVNEIDRNTYKNPSEKCYEVLKYIKNIKENLENCFEKGRILDYSYIEEIIKKFPKRCVGIYKCRRNVETHGQTFVQIISEIEKFHKGSEGCKEELTTTEEVKPHSTLIPETHESTNLKSIYSHKVQKHVNEEVSDQQTIVSQEKQGERNTANHLDDQHEEYGLKFNHHFNPPVQVQSLKESLLIPGEPSASELDINIQCHLSQRFPSHNSETCNKSHTVDFDKHTQNNVSNSKVDSEKNNIIQDDTIQAIFTENHDGLYHDEKTSEHGKHTDAGLVHASSESEGSDSEGFVRINFGHEISSNELSGYASSGKGASFDSISGSKDSHDGNNNVPDTDFKGFPEQRNDGNDTIAKGNEGSGAHEKVYINGVANSTYNNGDSGKNEEQNDLYGINATKDIITAGKDIVTDGAAQVDQGISFKTYIIIALIPLIIILLLIFLIKVK
ncbi:variable surface protein [Plasmodium gonderi]|uniref:Variable surface protein n=1 Tax=Plasmodium gonderi TaxID=77519 RepID=A0A1Y1JW85_PLAGO|nr:variable surface protein [Plasmodium gonderi]GAW84124.1 variable surface protein [Plasmodium gonderi]